MMRYFGLTTLALAATLLIGCSGGTGADGELALGSVALMVSEQSAGDDDGRVFAKFTEVALLPHGGGDPVVLFKNDDGEETDLLEEDFLLSLTSDVPPGRYDAVRVGIIDVRFEGGDCGDVTVELPGGSVILVPDEIIVVGGGDSLIVRIKLDLDKSIDDHAEGEPCTFLPVVDVEVEEGDEIRDDCPRTVFGEVEKILLDAEDALSGFVLALGSGRGELTVELSKPVSIFDQDGLASDSDEIAVGADLTVKGLLGRHGLDALVVVVGETLTIHGRVDDDLADGLFPFVPDSGQAVVGDTDVSVVDETLIQRDCELAKAAGIVAGARAAVVGKLDIGEQIFRAVCVELEPLVLEGFLTAVTTAEGGFDLTVEVEDDDEERMIFVDEETGIHLAGDGRIRADFLSELVDCAARPVIVFLDPEALDMATEVRVGSENFAGPVAEVDAAERRIKIGNSLSAVQIGATILDLREGQELVSLDDIDPGDEVRLFGLDACEDDDVDFYAFVVLILPDRDEEIDDDDEGCGLGFWKNHPEVWPEPYDPSTPFEEAFDDDAFGDMTLQQVLEEGGGGLIALGRHAVAAFLNAASDEVDYPLSKEAVIRLFQDRSDVEHLKDEFEELNEEHCPFDDDHHDDDDDHHDDDHHDHDDD